MSNVFVIDTNKQPLDTIHPARARILLTSGKAAVLKRYPFTIRLKVAVDNPQVAELRIKLDPGSKTTGIAIVNDQTGEVVFAAKLTHRGQAIKKSLDDRRGVRHGRRARQTRYRKPRWQNRRRPKGWLPPSRKRRISHVLTWVQRLARVCHITNISLERVKFDMQAMENAEVSGVEYQQGTLAGYKELFQRLEALGWPIECGSGGLTKYNRTTRELPKTHWLDAACVGESTPEVLKIKGVLPLSITAYGHGCRQMQNVDTFGFPSGKPKAKKFKHGFKTGDIVKAMVPKHLKTAGTHIGRMSAKACGAFTIATTSGTVPDVGKNYCRKLQRADGYGYSQRSA